MEKYVFTGFSAEYWNKWGISWLASLKELAEFDGKSIVFAHDTLPATVLSKLESHGVIVVDGHAGGTGRNRTLLMAEPWIAKNPGVYIHWDGDVYFQDSLDPLFEIAATSMVSAGNGMVGGPSDLWALFFDFHRTAQLVCPMSVIDALDQFNKYLTSFATPVDSVWNFSNLPALKWDQKFTRNDRTVPVIHLSEVKFLPDFHFENKYPHLHARWKGLHIPTKLVNNHK